MYASIGSPGAKTLTSFARRRCSTTKRRRGLAAEPILPGEAPLRVGELEPEASALLKPQPKPRVAAILEVCSLHCAGKLEISAIREPSALCGRPGFAGERTSHSCHKGLLYKGPPALYLCDLTSHHSPLFFTVLPLPWPSFSSSSNQVQGLRISSQPGTLYHLDFCSSFSFQTQLSHSSKSLLT